MKKLLGALIGVLGFVSLVGCSEKQEEPSVPQLFDNPATEIDHYFSNKVSLADTGVTVKKDKDGKLAGDFIVDGIAKVKLKSVTDGDTAVFHVNPGTTEDTFTVKGKTYPWITLRYMGIDTPESTSSIDAWGKAASNYGKELLTKAEGIIIDATDLPSKDPVKGYIDRLDSNGSRWLGLVWYCPEGQDAEDLNNYRSYQLAMIEECYTFSTNFSTERQGYLIDEKEEPILYSRYNHIEGEETPRFGTIKLNEVFYEADLRMSKTGKKIRIQGEVDPGFDYSTKATEMTITEAKEKNVELQQRGTFVRLTGVITRFIGNNFYFEDAEGSALYVYMGIDGNSINSMFNVGDTISIQGRICTFGGQLQMSGIVFKRETFVKITDPDKMIPMPKPIKLTGNETHEELNALLGKLVTMEITNDYTGSQSKNGAFSITNDKVINNHPLLKEVQTSAKPGSAEWDEACFKQLGVKFPPLELQVRVDGALAPGYLDRYDDEFKKLSGKGKRYQVTGIMSVFYEEDYQVELSHTNPGALYSYQITIGNAFLDNHKVNEILPLN